MLSGLRAFFQDTAGNVAVSFAMLLAPITVAVGGALDYSRTFTIGAEIQSALDAGTLAAASLTQNDNPETVVRRYIEAALSEHDGVIERLVVQVDANVAVNAREVTADAVIAVPTVMLGLVGIDTLRLGRISEATEQVRNVEVSLVLDISGSMSGSKITALREAAAEFITVVMDPNLTDMTSMSVIPYNGGVRLPRVVNADLINAGNADTSGCPELGVDDPIRLDLPDDGYDWLDWQGREQRDSRSSAFCPEQNEAATFLRNNRTALLNLVDDLDAGGNTGLDLATAWGARALDPAWRGRLGGEFPDRPVAYGDEGTLKVLVVMTDGAATAQYRTYQDAWGYWRTSTLYSASRARSNMATACDRAEANGVVIYTIAFQVSGSTNRDLMRECASKPENYYEVEDLDIAAAFTAIAADLNSLRLAR